MSILTLRRKRVGESKKRKEGKFPNQRVGERKERQGVMNSIIDFFWNDGEPTNDRVWPVSLSNTFACHESLCVTLVIF